MKLSFCITCKNRFHQISRTLIKNLQDNIETRSYVDFVLVDFGSGDGLRNWVTLNLKRELNSGYLKYFFTEELVHWNASIAKNTAHLLATGEILVNLDCDNFTGRYGAAYVIKQFIKYGPTLLLHQSSSDPRDGSFGRISMLKKYFHLIGGYNEKFNPMGYQDVDLIRRLVEVGLTYTPKFNSLYNRAIPNTKEEGLLYTNSSKTYLDMVFENMSMSNKNINSSNILANNGLGGIKNGIFQYLNDVFLEVNINI